MSAETRSSELGEPQVVNNLGPGTRQITSAATDTDFMHDPTTTRPKSSAARTGVLRRYVITTPRKEAILPQPDDALS